MVREGKKRCKWKLSAVKIMLRSSLKRRDINVKIIVTVSTTRDYEKNKCYLFYMRFLDRMQFQMWTKKTAHVLDLHWEHLYLGQQISEKTAAKICCTWEKIQPLMPSSATTLEKTAHQIKARTIGQPQLNHCVAHISRSAECECVWTHTWWLKPALTYISVWWQAAAGKWVCGALTKKTCCSQTRATGLRQTSRTEHREEHHDHWICTEQQDGTCSCEKNIGCRTWAHL